jgi:hypothetical protein
MSYKPDEKDWMAYLYGELEGKDKERMDQYLLGNIEARKEFERFQNLRKLMSSVDDKEVIAPPIIIEGTRQRFLWNTPAFRTIVSIAASLLLIILVGKATGARVSITDNEFRLSFGEQRPSVQPTPEQSGRPTPVLTADDVQTMINSSLASNNSTLQENWTAAQKRMFTESQKKLDASIRENLAVTSLKIDELLQTAATASRGQVEAYVATLERENSQRMKDYFELTSTQQKKYIEDLVVDFAQYLQQQRNNDLQLIQNRLMNIEQNTTSFQQETEQILTSIISSVGTTPKETKN